MRLLAVLTVSIAVLGAGAASAGDFPPNVAVTAIVVNKSIGAAKLGMTYKKAINAWGEQGDCKLDKQEEFCFYDDDESLSSLRFKGGKLDSIIIGADPGKKGGFVREFTYFPGINIGSTRTQVRKALSQNEEEGKITLGQKSDSVSKDGRSTNFIYTGNRLTTVSMYR